MKSNYASETFVNNFNEEFAFGGAPSITPTTGSANNSFSLPRYESPAKILKKKKSKILRNY